jgi:hypothetical protein
MQNKEGQITPNEEGQVMQSTEGQITPNEEGQVMQSTEGQIAPNEEDQVMQSTEEKRYYKLVVEGDVNDADYRTEEFYFYEKDVELSNYIFCRLKELSEEGIDEIDEIIYDQPDCNFLIGYLPSDDMYICHTLTELEYVHVIERGDDLQVHRIRKVEKPKIDDLEAFMYKYGNYYYQD